MKTQAKLILKKLSRKKLSAIVGSGIEISLNDNDDGTNNGNGGGTNNGNGSGNVTLAPPGS